MLGYLIILFTLVPIAELALLIKAGQYLGAGNTISIVIITGVAGAMLAKSQGLIILKRIQQEVNRGMMPAAELLDGFLILAGGILLITPGLITDCIGFLALVPFFRSLFKLWLKQKIKHMLDQGEIITIYRQN